MFLQNQLHNRLLQVSVFASIVYYLTATPLIFEKVRKYFPVKFKKVHHLLIFHTFVFGVLMYLLTYFVFDPALRVFEGNNDTTSTGNTPSTCETPPSPDKGGFTIITPESEPHAFDCENSNGVDGDLLVCHPTGGGDPENLRCMDACNPDNILPWTQPDKTKASFTCALRGSEENPTIITPFGDPNSLECYRGATYDKPEVLDQETLLVCTFEEGGIPEHIKCMDETHTTGISWTQPDKTKAIFTCPKPPGNEL